jgi:hypothetical protein
MPGFGANAVTVRAMRHDRLLFVLVPLFLMVVGALVIKQIWLREEAKPVAKAPVVDKAGNGGPQRDESRQGLTPSCEKELRRTADLLRFFKHNRSLLT